MVKTLPANVGDMRDVGSIPESGRAPGKGMAAHSIILARRIPWTEEPGGRQSMGLQSCTQMRPLGMHTQDLHSHWECRDPAIKLFPQRPSLLWF